MESGRPRPPWVAAVREACVGCALARNVARERATYRWVEAGPLVLRDSGRADLLAGLIVPPPMKKGPP